MKIVKLNSVFDKVQVLRETGNLPGVSTGYANLDEHYTVKRGNTTFILGHPIAGKTSFTIQLLCNLTSLHGWKHVIYSPETGNAADIYSEIIHCLTGQTFNKKYSNYIPERALYDVQPFVSDYFTVIEPEEENPMVTIDDWYNAVSDLMKEKEIHSAVIDNWNDIEHDLTKQGGKISEYLKFQLPRFNKYCKSKDIHGFMLAHPRSPDMKGKKEVPPPRMDEFEGGSLFGAKAQSVLIIHRDWSDHQNYTTDIQIAKIKPKIVGKRGLVHLDYHPSWNCYSDNTGIYPQYPYSPFKEQQK